MNYTSDEEKIASSSLVFYNITKANEGWVQCNGQNEVGNVSSVGFFKVFGKSFIWLSREGIAKAETIGSRIVVSFTH